MLEQLGYDGWHVEGAGGITHADLTYFLGGITHADLTYFLGGITHADLTYFLGGITHADLTYFLSSLFILTWGITQAGSCPARL